MRVHAMVWIFALSLLKVVASARLESYNIDPNAISVSGLSAGGFMAVQMHVSYSKLFMGVGVIAAGPYWCAQNNLFTATGECMSTPSRINVSYLQQITRNTALAGFCDPVSNMQQDRIYLFSGTLDTTVNSGVVEAAEEYYLEFVDPASIKTEYSIPAQHGFPTVANGGNCGSINRQTYINKCDYDAAYELLGHIYGDLEAVFPTETLSGNILKFDQTEFFGGAFSGNIGLEDEGYLFVPDSCRDKTKACKLHITLHGCHQSSESIGDIYVKETGYNEVGALNDIIILYPQVKSNLVSNPNGCFDWWGYTGSSYASNIGDQVVAIREMVTRLANM